MDVARLGWPHTAGAAPSTVARPASRGAADLPPLPEVLRAPKRAPRAPRAPPGHGATGRDPEGISDLARKGAWAEALDVLQTKQQQQEVEVFHYNAAISACSRARQARVANTLHQEMMEIGMSPDVYTYGALMRSADSSAAQRLLKDMEQQGIRRNVVITSLAMKAMVKSGDWRNALELFQAEASPDAQLFTAALTACGAGSCWQEAIELLEDMPRRHAVPDLIAYNAGMTACAQAQQWEQALWILQGMDVTPDLYSFNTALHSLGSRWQMALEIFSRLPGLKPDTVSFNTLLQMLPEHRSALHLLEEMKDASVRRNDRSYAAAMAVSQWEEALMLFEQCKQEDIAPTLHLFGPALQACSLGRQWQMAIQLTREMQGAALRPNNEVVAAAINSCVVPFDSGQGGFWLQALNFFEELKEAREQPDGVTYIALLSAFASCSRWEEALQLHRHTQHVENVPRQERLRCTNSAITACGRGIAWPMAMELFQEIPRPSLVTHNALLSALAEGSQWHRALQVLQSLPRQKLTPSVVTLNSVLHALCRGSHHVAAQRLLGRMPSYSLTADLYSYTTVMSACTSVSCWETTCELLCTMISKEIDPDLYSINNMIGALANTPKWKEAMHMFSNMENFRFAPDFVTHSVIIAGRIQAMVQEGQEMPPLVPHSRPLDAVPKGAASRFL